MRRHLVPAQGRRRRWVAVVAPAAALLLGLAVTPEARAHEFALALVLAPLAEGDATGRDVVDGFRLGVEESPDVSHPPGGEAGDHLGGVDVEVKVIEAAEGQTAGVQEAVAGAASVVVVLGTSPDTAAAVAPALAGSGVLLVDAGPEPPAARPGSGGVLRLRDRAAEANRSPATPRFAAAFERRHGRPPTEWAARGYDAARLLDVSLSQLGPDSRDVEAMAAAANASADLVRSTVVAGPAPPQDGAPARSPAPARQRSFGTVTAVGGAVALGAIALAVAAHRLRRRSEDGVPPG